MSIAGPGSLTPAGLPLRAPGTGAPGQVPVAVKAALAPLPQSYPRHGRHKPPLKPGTPACGTLAICSAGVPTVSQVSNARVLEPTAYHPQRRTRQASSQQDSPSSSTRCTMAYSSLTGSSSSCPLADGSAHSPSEGNGKAPRRRGAMANECQAGSGRAPGCRPSAPRSRTRISRRRHTAHGPIHARANGVRQHCRRSVAMRRNIGCWRSRLTFPPEGR